MRTQYLLDDVRRRAGDAVRRILERQERTERERRLRLAWLAAVLLVIGAGAWVVWRAAFAPPAVQAPAAQASVPAHQLSGPLANPWGPGAPVVGERGAEGAASAAAAGASAPPEAALARVDTAFASPAAREAVRTALAQLRGSARAADFVQQATQRNDPAALVAAWMAERQCRQVAQWRLAMEWRARATNPGARVDLVSAAVPIPGVSPQLRSLISRCVDMPEETKLDAALAAAGFPATADALEPTRRPLDLTGAVAIGDPALLAAVIDASRPEDIVAWVAARAPQRGQPQTPLDVLRSALWLASCRGVGEGGAAGGGAARVSNPRGTCPDHPAVWHACTEQGLCDGRDLHDVLLRTLSTEEWHASERLANQLAPLMGR